MAICTSSGVTWSWILSFSNEGMIIRVNYAENKVDILLKSKLDMFTLDLVALDRSKMLVASFCHSLSVFVTFFAGFQKIIRFGLYVALATTQTMDSIVSQ